MDNAYQTLLGQFLSTPSARRATLADYLGLPTKVISIHALREEGDTPSSVPKVADLISIHALREEGDCGSFAAVVVLVISIHALREEGDTESVDATVEAIKFLSTPSARRATYTSASHWRDIDISIHALREEGDWRCLPRP